jgi:hypothetical protein
MGSLLRRVGGFHTLTQQLTPYSTLSVDVIDSDGVDCDINLDPEWGVSRLGLQGKSSDEQISL